MDYTKQEIENGYTAKDIVDLGLLDGIKTVHQVYYLERIGLIKGYDSAPYLKLRKPKYPKAEIERLQNAKVNKGN